ncbi:MAG: TRZ/ATZ family hydrolase [Pseudomonadota bacterium]
MNACDTLIHAGWAATANPEQPLIENAVLAISDGRIVALGPVDAVRPHWQAKQQLERPDALLIPGLINAHTHAAMALLRGVGDDMPLQAWLEQRIWPLEGQFVSESFVRDGTRLALAEMIRAGITCFNDMYFCADTVAQTAIDARARVCIGLVVLDFPTMWASDADEYLQKAQAVHDQFAGHALVTTQFAPHSPYAVSEATLARARTLANQLDLKVHTHLHETASEVSQSLSEHGATPLDRLDQLGMVNGSLLAAHMTQMSEADIARVAQARMSVVHCPQSNMKLASGTAPVPALLQAGVNVALGTDGSASNNNLDMIEEMRAAALLAKVVSGDPTALPAMQALEMATINGARALGIDEHTGSLEIGKWADITCVNLNAAHLAPVYDPVSTLVYAASAADVQDVFVAGRALLQDRQLMTIDEADALARAREWRERIQTAI